MTDAYYVYAILSHDTPVPAGIEGFDGRPVQIVAHGALAAAASVLDASGVQPTVEAVLKHEEVVERLRQSAPALPVRFGAVFADADGIVTVLSRQYETLLIDLKKLGDKVEYGLTVLWPGPTDDREVDESASSRAARSGASRDTEGPGTQYLHARLKEQRRDLALRHRAQALLDLLEADLAPFYLDSRRTILPTPRIAVRAAYLLHPTKVGAYQEAFEGCRTIHPELQFLLNGPWPPYSFVSAPGPNHLSSPVGEFGKTSQVVTEEVVHG